MSWETAGGEVGEGQSRSEGRCWGGGRRQAGKLGPLGEVAPANQTFSGDAQKRGESIPTMPGWKGEGLPRDLGRDTDSFSFLLQPPELLGVGSQKASSGGKSCCLSAKAMGGQAVQTHRNQCQA